MAGAREATADLMALLQRHYIKPGEALPGGVFLPEVGWNGGLVLNRADALYVGFTGTSGRVLVGHEVKVSRADWQKEMDSPGKADAWADQCHEWWLVTLPDIVRPGELPLGWGHMVPGKSRTRMTVLTRAQRHPDRQPSWDAVRSILARQDTLRSAAIHEGQRTFREKTRLESEEAIKTALERQRAQYLDSDDLRKALDRVERALGGRVVEDGTITDYRFRRNLIPESVLTDLAGLLAVHSRLEEAARILTARYATQHTARMREALDMLDGAHEAAVANFPTRSPQEY